MRAYTFTIIHAETVELKKLDNNDAPFAAALASEIRVAAGLLQCTTPYQNLQTSLDSACSEITGARKTLFERSENRRQIPSRSAF